MDPLSLLGLAGPLVSLLSSFNTALKEYLDRLEQERQALPTLRALKVECDNTTTVAVVIRDAISDDSSQKSGERDELVGILRADLEEIERLVTSLSQRIGRIFGQNKSTRDIRRAVVGQKAVLDRKIKNIRRKREQVEWITNALRVKDNLFIQQTLESILSRLGGGEQKNRELMEETMGENRPDVIERLLEGGADANFLAIDSSSPDQPKVVSPLLNAIRNAQNSYDAVDVLLTKGALPNLVVGNQPPLWLAFECGNVEAATLLLDAGADVECPCVQGAGRTLLGTTVFSDAFAHRRLELIQLALEYQADKEARAPDGNTPLLDAVQARRGRDVVDLLLRANADANSRALARDDLTPLMMAAKFGDEEVALLVATYAVETKLTSRDGLTAGDIAEREGHAGLAKDLNDYDF